MREIRTVRRHADPALNVRSRGTVLVNSAALALLTQDGENFVLIDLDGSDILLRPVKTKDAARIYVHPVSSGAVRISSTALAEELGAGKHSVCWDDKEGALRISR